MKTYKVTRTLDLFTGQIGLTQAQAEPRRRKLEAGKNGVYTIIAPVQFKAGEVIRLPEVPKVLLRSMEEIKPDEKKGKEVAPVKKKRKKIPSAKESILFRKFKNS